MSLKKYAALAEIAAVGFLFVGASACAKRSETEVKQEAAAIDCIRHENNLPDNTKISIRSNGDVDISKLHGKLPPLSTAGNEAEKALLGGSERNYVFKPDNRSYTSFPSVTIRRETGTGEMETNTIIPLAVLEPHAGGEATLIGSCLAKNGYHLRP